MTDEEWAQVQRLRSVRKEAEQRVLAWNKGWSKAMTERQQLEHDIEKERLWREYEAAKMVEGNFIERLTNPLKRPVPFVADATVAGDDGWMRA